MEIPDWNVSSGFIIKVSYGRRQGPTPPPQNIQEANYVRTALKWAASVG